MAFHFAISFFCHCSLLLNTLKATSTNWEVFTPNAPFNFCKFLLISEALCPKKDQIYHSHIFRGLGICISIASVGLINPFQKFREADQWNRCHLTRSTQPVTPATRPVSAAPLPWERRWRPSPPGSGAPSWSAARPAWCMTQGCLKMERNSIPPGTETSPLSLCWASRRWSEAGKKGLPRWVWVTEPSYLPRLCLRCQWSL